MAQTNFKELISISTIGINAKNTGTTTIGTTENGTQKFHPMFVIMVISSGSAISVVPTISIGTNASSYNNLVAATAMTNLTALGNMQQPALVATYGNVAANTAIVANVSVGSTATTCLVDIHVFGFYN